MKKALNLLPHTSGHYGFDSFNEGFRKIGFEPVVKLGNPSPEDVLVIWNRSMSNAVRASHFDRAGARVLVVENGPMGKVWRGAQWYSVALDHHNGAGRWPDVGPGRFTGWGMPLDPWRAPGGETIVLGQRGIGERGLASPKGWEVLALRQFKGARFRKHPGPAKLAIKAVPLATDLAKASAVVTWGSAAAIMALTMGIPVYYDFHKWIGGSASRHMNDYNQGPRCDDAARLKMFERLAYAMWTRAEISTGVPLDLLLNGPCV